jgi:hypothetical protein
MGFLAKYPQPPACIQMTLSSTIKQALSHNKILQNIHGQELD